MKKIYILLFTFLCSILNSQELSPEKLKISNSISEYFALDRETIHLQLNKNIFISNEEIWFSGFVFDRKNSTIFNKTVNIYASILNKDGSKVEQKLLYCENGRFSGSFKLNKNYESGDYYIQVYTNWMNNFIEDESFVSKIQVINETDNSFLDSNKVNYSNIKVEFFPEGNSYIENVSNNIGIKISDCNSNPVMVNDIEIFNSKNESLKILKTNQFGFGKFKLTPTDEIYKAVFYINEKKYENFLPKVNHQGITFEVNNLALKDKTIVKIKTNELSLKTYQKQNLTLVIQQDEKLYFFDVNFNNNNLNQELIFSNDYLYDGFNTIRLIDNENKLLCERLIYNHQEISNKTEVFVESKIGAKINLAGNTALYNSNLSISVMPENSICTNGLTDIFASFLLNPYLSDKVINAKYYLNEISGVKKNELDLLLLNQNSIKYNWNNLLNNPPKNKYEFQQGITIKGTINQKVNKPENFKIKAYSISSQILKFSEINIKDEFLFENLIVPDSSKVNFSLVTNMDFKAIPLNYYAQIVGKNKSFFKQFIPKNLNCFDSIKKFNSVKFTAPKLNKNEILLSEVEIKAKKKKLINENIQGNSNLRGYKISDLDGNISLLDFISSKGFVVKKNVDEVFINLKKRGSIYNEINFSNNIQSQLNQTVVFIDNFIIASLNELTFIQLNNVDEIYYNANVEYTNGIIKIYLKKPKPRKAFTNSFLISGGFEMINNFKSQDYASTFDSGFDNFGVVDFKTNITTNENGYFRFEIPNYQKKNLKFLIEGINNEGKIISEIISIQIE
jgi:hypothetical protein